MSRSVTIQRWCDACEDELGGVDPVEANHSPLVALNNGHPRTLDLCERHNAALVEPLGRLLSAYGVRPDTTTPTKARRPRTATVDGRRPIEALVGQASRMGRPSPSRDANPSRCLWCPLTYTPTGGGLGRHLLAHGFPTKTISAAYGSTCPICGKEGVLTRGGPHVRQHGPELRGTPHLFAAAMLEGDPFGIVAERFKAAPDKASVQWTLEDYAASLTA